MTSASKFGMWSALACALTFGVATAACADDPVVRSTPYYQLEVGARWEYRASGVPMTQEVVKHEVVDGIACALVETTMRGRVVTREHIGVHEDGVYRHTHNGKPVDPPVCLLKLPPKVGEQWDVVTRVGERPTTTRFTLQEAGVKTPAGVYETLLVSTPAARIGAETVALATWFAPNVGVVKRRMKLGDSDIVEELVRYTPAKPAAGAE